MVTLTAGTTATLMVGTMVIMAIVITVRIIDDTATVRGIMAAPMVAHITAEDMVMVVPA